MKTTPKSVVLAVMLLASGGAFASENTSPFAAPVVAGQLAEPKNLEASGLAISRRTDNLLWTHNDSGGEPVLFALTTEGDLRGKVHIEGVKNEDWEDLASFELDGKAMLLIADTGNNFTVRSPCVLHVVAEPDAGRLSPEKELSLIPEYSIHFVFEDGPRDCEAVAVDANEGMIYLLAKRSVPARLYRLPLKAADKKLPATARFVASVPLPQPAGLQKMIPAPLFGLRGEPTAMDFSADGRMAVVLVYGGPVLFTRERREPWAEALAREPVMLPGFDLPQAEAACFSRNGQSIFICSEKVPRLLRYDWKK